MNDNEWREKHGQVIKEFLEYLNGKTSNYILKGGTSLMMCYNLDRFSEDIDLDSVDKRRIGEIVSNFCEEKGYEYRIAKDTDTVKRFMISYDKDTQSPKPLKIEVSYRKRTIEQDDVTVINGINVYNINNIALMKASAYGQRDKIRDLYDVSFICNNYYEQLEKITRNILREALLNKGIEQYDMVVKYQDDKLIDKDKLAVSFLSAWEKMGLSEKTDNSLELSKIESKGSIASDFEKFMSATSTSFPNEVASGVERNKYYIVNNNTACVINIEFEKGEIEIYQNDDKISWGILKKRDKELYEIGRKCEKTLKSYMKECGNKSFNKYFNRQSGTFDGYF